MTIHFLSMCLQCERSLKVMLLQVCLLFPTKIGGWKQVGIFDGRQIGGRAPESKCISACNLIMVARTYNHLCGIPNSLPKKESLCP